MSKIHSIMIHCLCPSKGSVFKSKKVAPTHFTTWHRVQSSIWYCRSLKWCLLSRRAYTQRREQHEVHVCVCVQRNTNVTFWYL